jgi:hypothetical protein
LDGYEGENRVEILAILAKRHVEEWLKREGVSE